MGSIVQPLLPIGQLRISEYSFNADAKKSFINKLVTPLLLFQEDLGLNRFGNRIQEVQGESLAGDPKLLSMYRAEQRGFLVRKCWQTGSFIACQTALERNLVKDVHHRSVASRNWLKI